MSFTEPIYGDLDQGAGALQDSWPVKRYHSGGAITLKPNWSYFGFCGTGSYLRFGLRRTVGGAQITQTLQFDNGDQNTTKQFFLPLGSGNPGDIPAGNFGLLGRTFASGHTSNGYYADPEHQTGWVTTCSHGGALHFTADLTFNK